MYQTRIVSVKEKRFEKCCSNGNILRRKEIYRAYREQEERCIIIVVHRTGSISRVKFTGLQPGSYRLVITAESVDGERYTERRDVTVCKSVYNMRGQ